MDQLTALERELLRSVEALASSAREEASALREGLKRYASETSQGMERRLRAIEKRQDNIEGLLNALVEQLEAFATVSKRSEASVNALRHELSRSGR